MTNKSANKNFLTDLSLILTLVILAYFYLAPGPRVLLEKNKTEVMSDGTDSATLPFTYQVVINKFHSSPKNLFFGAVPTEQMNAPDNYALWLPWVDKWSVVFWSEFFPVEQISTAFAWELLVLNGVLFYFMGLCFNWGRALSFAGALAFTFNAYIRGRAKVHIALMGIYFLPAIFLGLHLLRDKPNHKKTLLATTLFLLAATTAHYYLILTIAFSPFFLLYFFLSAKTRQHWKSATLRLITATLPAVLFLAWCFLNPLPSEYMTRSAAILPNSNQQVDENGFHPFMTIFASRPLDYLGGDTAISQEDWNPLRSKITAQIYSDLGDGNPHERANGVRWLILAFLLVAIVNHVRSLQKRSRKKNTDLSFFLMLAAFAFAASLKPSWFGIPIGPSGWIHSFVEQFRVPSRVGILAQFGILCAVGTYLASLIKKDTGKARYFILAPLLVLAEYSPLNLAPMPLAPILPAIKTENCGRGLYLPYVSSTYQMLKDYYFLQQLRGSNCQIMNATMRDDLDTEFLTRFPLTRETAQKMQANDPQLKQNMIRFAQCSKIDWIFFDFEAPESFMTNVCTSLGWTLHERRLCGTNSPKNAATKDEVIRCLRAVF